MQRLPCRFLRTGRRENVSSNANAETTCGAQEAASRHTTSDPEGGGGDGPARTHSNAAGQTPPDRRNVKMCAFQQKGRVVTCHNPTQAEESQTGNRRDYLYQLTAHH